MNKIEKIRVERLALAQQYYLAYMDMPNRLRHRREQLGLSYSEASRIAEVTRENIVKAECGAVVKGKRNFYHMQPLQLCQLAVALKAPPAYLQWGVFSIESFDNELKGLFKRLQALNSSERKETIGMINEFLDNTYGTVDY